MFKIVTDIIMTRVQYDSQAFFICIYFSAFYGQDLSIFFKDSKNKRITGTK